LTIVSIIACFYPQILFFVLFYSQSCYSLLPVSISDLVFLLPVFFVFDPHGWNTFPKLLDSFHHCCRFHVVPKSQPDGLSAVDGATLATCCGGGFDWGVGGGGAAVSSNWSRECIDGGEEHSVWVRLMTSGAKR
jgi:hypothetical protein